MAKANMCEHHYFYIYIYLKIHFNTTAAAEFEIPVRFSSFRYLSKNEENFFVPTFKRQKQIRRRKAEKKFNKKLQQQ